MGKKKNTSAALKRFYAMVDARVAQMQTETNAFGAAATVLGRLIAQLLDLGYTDLSAEQGWGRGPHAMLSTVLAAPCGGRLTIEISREHSFDLAWHGNTHRRDQAADVEDAVAVAARWVKLSTKE